MVNGQTAIIFPLQHDETATINNLGVGPFIGEYSPMPTQPALYISGVTKNSLGVPLGNCVCHLFRTVGDVFVEQVLSDGIGDYMFSPVGLGQQYYVVAYKAGSPDVAGTTVNTLVGTVSGSITPLGIVQIQKKGYGSTSSSASHSITLDFVPAQGDLLILGVSADTTTSGTPAGWSLANSAIDGPGTYIYYKIAGSSESTTITVNLSGSAPCELAVMEYTGVTTLDKTASATGQTATTTFSSGATATTTAANELLVGVTGIAISQTITITAWQNSFVSQIAAAASPSNSGRLDMAALVVSSVGAYNAQATCSAIPGVQNNTAIIATFK